VIAVLAGGTGGAKLARGMLDVVGAAELTVIANTADDVEIYGVHVSPDPDLITYWLADRIDSRGFGIAGDTWHLMDALEDAGHPTWFRLGDRDLATHLYRTHRLGEGATLSDVTAELARRWGLDLRVLPMTDQRVETRLDVEGEGEIGFQDYFVARRHAVPVTGVRFAGAETARPGPGVLEALHEADVILLAPSNPYVSIAPILAVERIRRAIERRRVPCIAVSPLIGGRAVKGPAAVMLQRLQGGTTPVQVAQCYSGLIDALVFDLSDAQHADAVAQHGVRPVVAPTLMSDADARRRLAEACLDAMAVA